MDTVKLHNVFEALEASTAILLEELQDFTMQLEKLKAQLDKLEIELLEADVADLGSITVKTPMTQSRKEFIVDILRTEDKNLNQDEKAFLNAIINQDSINDKESKAVTSIFNKLDQLNKLNYN